MKEITGKEQTGKDERLDAVIRFYKAFNEQDIELMKSVWAAEQNIVMCNPLGGVKHGWPEIEQVYHNIFHGRAKVYVEFFDYSMIASPEMFTIIGRERGVFKTSTDLIELAIRTSRVYQKTASGWRQVHHHGSIENPELLSAYQQAVQKP